MSCRTKLGTCSHPAVSGQCSDYNAVPCVSADHQQDAPNCDCLVGKRRFILDATPRITAGDFWIKKTTEKTWRASFEMYTSTCISEPL